ncbi:MAG: hypothetical protein M3081_22260 [Gemmatimonadota bacterium]|nr:hypothetical protein [Gemmatimonadota bacterium]
MRSGEDLAAPLVPPCRAALATMLSSQYAGGSAAKWIDILREYERAIQRVTLSLQLARAADCDWCGICATLLRT